MTIRGGFATQKQEKDYSKCLEALIVVLFKRIVKIYTNENCDEEQFKSYLLRILSCMFELEIKKQSNPKYSKRADNLCQVLNMDYKSAFNMQNKEQLQPKGSNFSSICNQIRRNYSRIQAYQKGSLDGNQSSQSTIQTGAQVDTKNISNHQKCVSMSGNTSITQYQNNSRLQVNAIKNIASSINSSDYCQNNLKRGESSKSQYRERFSQNNRPKSSSTYSSTINHQNAKGNNQTKRSIQKKVEEQQIIPKKKKYMDYLEKYNEDYFKDQDNSQSYQIESPSQINNLNLQNEEAELKELVKNGIEMEYSDDSLNDQTYQEENLQDEEQLMRNIEDIENEQNSQTSPSSLAYQNKLIQKSFENIDNKNTQEGEFQQNSNRYTKSKSALVCSLNANQSNDNIINSYQQLGSTFVNQDLNYSQSSGNNINVNQSFAIQNNLSVLPKEKQQKNQDCIDIPEQDTAHFKDQNFLSSSTSKLQKKNKEIKKDDILRNSKGNNLTIRQPRFSLSVDGDDDKKETTKNETEVSTKSPLARLNIIIPGKKNMGEITEEFIKANSPQFCQSQIEAIKQQLSTQTTYLQMQQKQLDEKLMNQQQDLQKQLQNNQIAQQQTLKNVQNKSDSNLFLEGNSHSQWIQEIQEEEEEEESIYKGSAKKQLNKIEKMQLRQLNKEKLIQNSKSKDERIQKVFVAEQIDYKFEDIVEANKNNRLNQTEIQKHQDQCLRRVDKDQNQKTQIEQKSKISDFLLQPSNNQTKRRVKIMSCHTNNQQDTLNRQQVFKDISNLHQNKFNETPCQTIERCNTDQKHERPRTGRKKIKINKEMQDEIFHQRQFKTIDPENLQNQKEQQQKQQSHNQQAQLNDKIEDAKEFNLKKQSLEPIVPKIAQNLQQKINSDTPTNQFKNPPLSTSSKRSRTYDYTNSSPLNSQFQQSPQPKVFINENNQLQRGQFKITKKKEVSQSFRDQFGDSIKELSTEIYINSNNANSKKSEQLTPFWGEVNNQKLKQSFVKEKNEDDKSNYSFYTQTIDSEIIQLPQNQLNQNAIISNIVNCPLNPSYINKITKQPRAKKDEKATSPKMNLRPQSSHTYHNYKQSSENTNTCILTQMQPKVYYQPSNSNSPISAFIGSTNNKKQTLSKPSQKDSYFKF